MRTTFEATELADTNPTRRARRIPAHRRDRRSDRGGAVHNPRGRWIVAAAAIGLTTLSLALAAPASAHGSHDGVDGSHHHTATTSVHMNGGGATSPTSPSSSTQNAAADPPAGNPSTSALPQIHPGHDKCKAEKGGRPGPPWCDDPSAGWEQSSLHRTDASFPTLPGAEAAAARSATIDHVSPSVH